METDEAKAKTRPVPPGTPGRCVHGNAGATCGWCIVGVDPHDDEGDDWGDTWGDR